MRTYENQSWYGRIGVDGRIPIGHYHTIAQPKGNLYQAVRKAMGLSRAKFAALINIPETALRYRERMKRTYHICEILALHEVSGMTWSEYRKLLNDIA